MLRRCRARREARGVRDQPPDAGYRVPMLPIAGHTQEITDALRLRVFLQEIDRQADLFNRSLADSIGAAARDDATDAWRHVQSALFAAIVVYRLVTNDRPWGGHGWTKDQAREAAK